MLTRASKELPITSCSLASSSAFKTSSLTSRNFFHFSSRTLSKYFSFSSGQEQSSTLISSFASSGKCCQTSSVEKVIMGETIFTKLVKISKSTVCAERRSKESGTDVYSL